MCLTCTTRQNDVPSTSIKLSTIYSNKFSHKNHSAVSEEKLKRQLIRDQDGHLCCLIGQKKLGR